MFDIIFSISVFILFFPVFLVIAIMIKIGSPGPVFYNSLRIGKSGSVFVMYKFRTMQKDADMILQENKELKQEYATKFKITNDYRITGVGKFLRRFSLDELPQILNILRGEMSWVGPRPILLEEKDRVSDLRMSVLPGLTGLWQICGKNDCEYSRKSELDRQYVLKRNILLDLLIIIKTIPAIIKGNGFY